MYKTIINGLKIGILIVGTTIGAGFSSGREIWEFFSSYGLKSIEGILIFMILFSISSILIIWISYKHKTSNYYDMLEILMGEKLAKYFDGIIFLYLLSVAIVMFAGSGATLEQLGYPYLLGIIILALATWIIIKHGVNGLININSILIPILIVILIYITYKYILSNHFISDDYIRGNLKVWPSSITYSALNAISLIGVLSTTGEKIKSKIEIIIGGILAGSILGIVAILLNLALLKVEYVQQYEIPLFSLIPENKLILLFIVSITIWFAIYTTVLSNIYGLVTRIQKKWSHISTGKLSFIIIVCIAPLSFFGFSTLVNILYPLYGVISLYLLATLLLYPFQN